MDNRWFTRASLYLQEFALLSCHICAGWHSVFIAKNETKCLWVKGTCKRAKVRKIVSYGIVQDIRSPCLEFVVPLPSKLQLICVSEQARKNIILRQCHQILPSCLAWQLMAHRVDGSEQVNLLRNQKQMLCFKTPA